MVAVYSITNSTYQKNFDAKVKSLHNSYTTDIHINKEQFGVLSVKFIITASDLVKIHKLYTFQSNPSYRLTFLDPETDFEYNIHCTSPFQQNRLGLKDVVSYFEFNLTADIIGLGAFPTYKTGDASFWTQWSERWEVGPVANQMALIAHPYYSNKFDLTHLTNYNFTHINTLIEASDFDSTTGNGILTYYRRYPYVTDLLYYDLTSIKNFDSIKITLNDCFCFNNSGYFRMKYSLSPTRSNFVLCDLYWNRTISQMEVRVTWYDGATGSLPIQNTKIRSYDGINRHLSFAINHNRKNSIISITIPTFESISYTLSSKEIGDIWSCLSSGFVDMPYMLYFGFIPQESVTMKAQHGLLEFCKDYQRKITI